MASLFPPLLTALAVRLDEVGPLVGLLAQLQREVAGGGLELQDVAQELDGADVGERDLELEVAAEAQPIAVEPECGWTLA